MPHIRLVFLIIRYGIPFYDIALILLEESAKKYTYRENQVWPACLPERRMSLAGELALVTGWGSTQPYKLTEDGDVGNQISSSSYVILCHPVSFFIHQYYIISSTQ